MKHSFLSVFLFFSTLTACNNSPEADTSVEKSPQSGKEASAGGLSIFAIDIRGGGSSIKLTCDPANPNKGWIGIGGKAYLAEVKANPPNVQFQGKIGDGTTRWYSTSFVADGLVETGVVELGTASRTSVYGVATKTFVTKTVTEGKGCFLNHEQLAAEGPRTAVLKRESETVTLACDPNSIAKGLVLVDGESFTASVTQNGASSFRFLAATAGPSKWFDVTFRQGNRSESGVIENDFKNGTFEPVVTKIYTVSKVYGKKGCFAK
jgi:hypothetical protein